VNILDTFVLMFEANTSGIKKGTDAGEASAKKLKKAVDDVDLSADKLAANFVNMAKNAASALAGVLALGAIKALVNDTVAHTAAVALQARAMGVSVETMSAYQAAVVSMGGTSDQARESLAKLRDGFVEMSRFGVMATNPLTMAFIRLGASAQQLHASIKDPTIALSAIADQFSRLDKTQQLYLGQKLGLDQGTIQLLSQGKTKFDEIIAKEKELHAITQAQADASIKYSIAQKELGMSFEAVKREIAGELLPAFTWVVQHLDQMITWLREHKAVAIATFAAIGAVVAVALVPPLVIAAGAMWALIAPALAAAAPFIALGLAIGLIVDDIEKFRSGQKSLIGEILARWPMVGQLARSIAEITQLAFKLIVDAIKWAAGIIVNEGVAAWNKYKGAFQPIIDLFDSGVKLLKSFWEWLGKIASVAAPKWLDKIGHWLAAATGGKYDDTSKPLDVSKPAAPSLGNAASGREIAAKLVASGWTPEQAAGIAGSFMQESHGKADARNATSGAYGLGQWLGSRRKDFEQWSGRPLEGSSLDDQIGFFNYETSHKEKAAGDRLRAARTASDAADIHAKYYERPGANEINLARREAYANMIAGGQSQVAGTNTPLATGGPVVAGASTSNSRSVSIGDVHVVAPTGTTNPDAFGIAVADALKKHINNAIDQHDNGIAG
jgi:Phage tail lysozyme